MKQDPVESAKARKKRISEGFNHDTDGFVGSFFVNNFFLL
ncbi:hypothetical protein P3T21_005939 [Paraburkholderia sp. GAS334]